MPKRTFCIVLVVVVAVVLVLTGIVGLLFYNGYRQFLVEDQITHEVIALASAIEQYRTDHNRWPDDLRELIPTYLPQEPDLSYMETIEVSHTPDLSEPWSVYALSHYGGEDRVYLYVSDGVLTSSQEARELGMIHGVYVLSGDRPD